MDPTIMEKKMLLSDGMCLFAEEIIN